MPTFSTNTQTRTTSVVWSVAEIQVMAWIIKRPRLLMTIARRFGITDTSGSVTVAQLAEAALRYGVRTLASTAESDEERELLEAHRSADAQKRAAVRQALGIDTIE